jgi:hypothetical protein
VSINKYQRGLLALYWLSIGSLLALYWLSGGYLELHARAERKTMFGYSGEIESYWIGFDQPQKK